MNLFFTLTVPPAARRAALRECKPTGWHAQGVWRWPR
jgi:hypothetical protein